MWNSLGWFKLLLILILICTAYYAVRYLLRELWSKLKMLHRSLEVKLSVRLIPERDFPSGQLDTVHPASFSSPERFPVYPVAEPASASMVKEQDMFVLAYRLSAEIIQTIQQAALAKQSREELISALHSSLKKDAFLKATAYRFALDNLVSVNCEKFCSMRLSGEELNQLWKG
jgi:hypothetical protein